MFRNASQQFRWRKIQNPVSTNYCKIFDYRKPQALFYTLTSAFWDVFKKRVVAPSKNTAAYSAPMADQPPSILTVSTHTRLGDDGDDDDRECTFRHS